MSRVKATQRIEAAPARVWAMLADLTALPRWSPGVERCHMLTEQAAGVGAIRFVGRAGRDYLKEEFVAWEPNREMSFRIIESSYPLRDCLIRTTLEPHGPATVVDVEITYRLKYGPIGRLLDAAFVRAAYVKGTAGMLEVLRRHVEAGAGDGAAGRVAP